MTPEEAYSEPGVEIDDEALALIIAEIERLMLEGADTDEGWPK